MLFHFLSHIYTLPAVLFQSALVVDVYCLYFVLNIQDFCSNPIGNYTVVSELLKCGYRSLEAKNQEGQTAVHLASRMGKDDILKKLIESGANINCRDTAGYTPLHVRSLLIIRQATRHYTYVVYWSYVRLHAITHTQFTDHTSGYTSLHVRSLLIICQATEMKSVYSVVRTGSLNKAVCASSLKG